MTIRPLSRSFCAVILACALVTPVRAAVELDAPEVWPSVAASSLIQLDVIAGGSGAPNGFTLQWMRASDYVALGFNWPTDPADPRMFEATFATQPSLNTVDGTTTFKLGSGQIATIQVGDIFDETGVFADHAAEELVSGTEYVFRVRAEGDAALRSGGTAGYLPSSYSMTHSCYTKPHDDHHECIHSQGYWKNHSSAWPVSSMKLGTVIYTKAQLLLIMNKPAAGNGIVSLAHQLIAAKLNVLSGAIPSTLIAGAINTADALIGNKVIPPVGAGYLPPSVTSHLTDDLEEFNDDEMEHDNCQITAVARPTWGQLKAMYR